jgi:hypothetical protein
MSWFNPKCKKHPRKIKVPQLRFLGEQDGPAERELKSRLAEIFDQGISAAYLARVAYGEKSFAVALCLRSYLGPDRGLIKTVAKIFASMFGSHEHLDIIFLSEAQEAELAMVCNPFL